MKAGLLYMKCALSCQQWLTLFIFISETSQICTGPPVFVLPHHKLPNFFGRLLVSYKLGKLRKYWTGACSCCAGALVWLTALTITRGTETGDEKPKRSAAVASHWVKKRFSIREISSHVFIAKCVSLSISSPCANETAGWSRPLSHLLIEEWFSWIFSFSGIVAFSLREMRCEMKSNMSTHAPSRDVFWR